MKRVKEKGMKLIKQNFLYILGVLLFTYKGILLNVVLGMEIGIEMYFLIAGIPALVLLPIVGKASRKSYLYLNISFFLITLLVYADYLYYQYATNFLSMYQIENIQYSEEISNSFVYLITVGMLLCFWLDNILLCIWSFLNFRKKAILEQKPVEKKYQRYLFYGAVLLINLLMLVCKVERTNDYFTYNKTLNVQHIGIYYYHFEDCKEYFQEMIQREKPNLEEISHMVQEISLQKQAKTPFTGVAEGNNIILLQLESLDEFIIEKTINGKEITPNLNQFYRENIYFSQMYNQGLGTTADSEHTIATGFFPLENGRVFQKYYKNAWQDIYSSLQKQGYHTSFMHPNISTFWNRYQVYTHGYQIEEYHDIQSFQAEEEYAGEFFSDEAFYRQAVKILDGYEEPFATMLVSVSTHIPYYLEGVPDLDEKLSLTKEDVWHLESEEMQNYLLSCNFADYSFGILLEELEKTGLLDHTILIVYGDHGAGLQADEDIAKIYQENELSYQETDGKLQNIHIPFGIRMPNRIQMTVTKVRGKIDTKATIFDLLGLEDSFNLGESLFSEKNHSFIKGLGLVTSEFYYLDEICIDRKTQQEIEAPKEVLDLADKMKQEMTLSDEIIKHNLVYKVTDRK